MSTNLAPDWILQQTLDVQRKAQAAWSNTKPELEDGGLTMTVLGCGTMGTAILKGYFKSLSESNKPFLLGNTHSFYGTGTAPQGSPPRVPSKFHACVRSHESAERVKQELDKFNARLVIHELYSLLAVEEADVVLLSCKPQDVSKMLRVDGMREALAGKLLISICASVSEEHIHDILYDGVSLQGAQKCSIVRAMPTLAAGVGESITVIGTPESRLPGTSYKLVEWIFDQVGTIVRLPSSTMEACTSLCGCGPAFTALLVESMVAGAVAMGVPRDAAHKIAAQTVRGSTALMLEGEHPATLRDQASTTGGPTFAGLAVLEDAGTRGTVTRGIREATTAAQISKIQSRI